MKKVLFLIFAIGASVLAASYTDANQSISERVKDLVSQMTLEEKVGQMIQTEREAFEKDPSVVSKYYLGSVLSGGGSAPRAGSDAKSWLDLTTAIALEGQKTRLKIPILYGIDAVHGHNNVFGATIFPQNIGLGATRNPELVREIGRITASEVYATGIRWTFSPCLCVARDEKWGRTYESFGEDPALVSSFATIIEGYQGKNLSDKGSILATAKHFAGDGGTVWGSGVGGKMDQGDTVGDEAMLRAIHLPPFMAAIDKNVGSVMPSFSSWNGVKMHGNAELLNIVLKKEMGFSGFVISDWQGINQIPADSYAEKFSTAINAGVDMVMEPYEAVKVFNTLLDLVKAGKISQARIDDAVSRILTKKFELGLFENPIPDGFGLDQIGSEQHREVARKAVQESMVLLKNKENTLPLKPEMKILVAGTHADNIGLQSGGWTKTWQGQSGNITPGTTILEGIENENKNVLYLPFPTPEDLVGKTFDIGVVIVGEPPYAEMRGDNGNLELGYDADEAIDTVCGAMKCMVVLVTGRPVSISRLLDKASAVVAAWLPGTEGNGVSDVLFGKANFSGKLPMTWFRDVSQLPINVGDERYDPLFPFGFGLSY